VGGSGGPYVIGASSQGLGGGIYAETHNGRAATAAIARKADTAMGKPRPNSILSREPKRGAPSKSTYSCSEHIGAVTIQDEQTRVKDF